MLFVVSCIRYAFIFKGGINPLKILQHFQLVPNLNFA